MLNEFQDDKAGTKLSRARQGQAGAARARARPSEFKLRASISMAMQITGLAGQDVVFQINKVGAATSDRRGGDGRSL